MSKVSTIRQYQQDVIERLEASLDLVGSTILQMPTGSGKTLTAAEFIRRNGQGKIIWFMCHRREIIGQTSRTFSQPNVGLHHDIISAGLKDIDLGDESLYTPGASLLIASVDTMINRVESYPKPDIVIWDEAHHAPAATWTSLHAKLPDARHVGLTATPERQDGKGLSDIFKDMVCGPSIRDLMDQGYLAKLRIFAPGEVDLHKAKIGASGDYTKASVEALMNSRVVIGDAVEHYQRHIPEGRAILFAASLKMSHAVVARFNESGIPAAHVGFDIDDHTRRVTMDDFKAGRIRVLSNVEVFTEGVDVPAADAVILMRPTKSLRLYLQMVGRGMRPRPDKVLTILDHAGCVYDHYRPEHDRPWSLEGGARLASMKQAAANGIGIRKCPECKYLPEERERVCACCGFAYPSGSEVGEADGLLLEFEDLLSKGFVYQKNFADMVGAVGATVKAWRDRGMPGKGAFVQVEPALNWLRANVKSRTLRPFNVLDPESYVPPHEFEKENGLTRGYANILKARGLPVADNSWVHSARGKDWLDANFVKPSERLKYYKIWEFAEKYEVSSATVSNWKKKGLPCGPNGKVLRGEGEAWVAKNITNLAPRKEVRSIFETKVLFSRRFSVTPSAVKDWGRQGLPCASNGMVEIVSGIAWVQANKAKSLPPSDVPDPELYEPAASFARRTGRKTDGGISSWKKRGLPCASNGWVHILEGLRWVQANTQIVIPPEAWPDGEKP